MAGSRMVLRRKFGALVASILAGSVFVFAAAPAAAIPIFDPSDMPPASQGASFGVAFANTPSGTPLSLNSADNQELESLGIRFAGAAFQPAAGLPFPTAHVGANGNRLTISFSLETIAIGVNVLSAAEDAEPDGLTFEASFEDGSTELFQFPLDPTDPDQVFGAPFSEEPAFAGFRTGASNLITQLDIFQSIVGIPDRPESIPAQASFPRVGNALLITIVPEPGGAVLLGIGLSALAGLRRMRRD